MSKNAAEQELLRLIRLGEPQQLALLTRVSQMVIRDRLVPPSQMLFEPQFNDLGGLTLTYGQEGGVTRIHRHALNQLAAKVTLPMTYVNRLLEGDTDETIWKRELLAHNLNELYKKSKFIERGGRPSAFLHRIVGSELRGFLSRSFNRHLASAPLLRAFIHACTKVEAKPVEAITTDVKFSLKCFRQMVFEPVKGDFIAVGVDWSNSDFGSGRMKVRFVVLRIKSGTAVSLSDEISRVHIGSVIEESDIEMSEETMAKEVETQASAIQDTVSELLSKDHIERLLKAIERAAAEEMSWARLKSQLAKYLYKDELTLAEGLLDKGGIVDLPPTGIGRDGNPLPTKWWCSALVAHIAGGEKDPDRKMTLQEAAGSFLKLEEEEA